MTGRPSFKRKHDVMIHGGLPRSDIEMDHAVAPFDAKATEMDSVWGVDRLPELVAPEMAARYGRALGALNEAISAGDIEKAVANVANCIRGMNAMDAAARAAGHEPKPPFVVVHEYQGERFGVLLDSRQWPAANKAHPDLRIVSLNEIGAMLRLTANPIVDAVKDAFPGAEVVELRRRKPFREDQEIPF